MIGKTLILIGIAFLLVGLVISVLQSTGIAGKLGKLPGDIYIKKGNTTIFIPITTSILISVLLSLLLFLIRK